MMRIKKPTSSQDGKKIPKAKNHDFKVRIWKLEQCYFQNVKRNGKNAHPNASSKEKF